MSKLTELELQSKTIDWLRFPLIIGVLFIHNADSNLIVGGHTIGTNSYLPVFSYCSALFSQVLGRISVPLFFFISGFLFFLNVNRFDSKSYVNKLKGRVKTLFIPYVFWNLITIVFIIIVSFIPQLSGLINRKFDYHLFLNYFWNHNGLKLAGAPFSYQFWFIRDLMIIVLLTPIIYFICKKTNLLCVIGMGLLWFFGYWFQIVGLNSSGIFFFIAGAYWGINKRNLLNDFRKVKYLSFILYPLLAVTDLVTKGYLSDNAIHKIGIIVGIVFCFNLIGLLFEKNKIKAIPFLSASSFFIFAIHEPFLLTVFRRITFLILKPKTDFEFTSLYFINVISVALVALGMYYLLSRIFPKFTSIITGGR